MTLTAYDLTGRTALVTGAGGGIGRATALLLAEAGAQVHCTDIDGEGAARTAEHIAGKRGTAHARTVDVTDREAVSQAVAAATREGGQLDIAVAAAGIMHRSTVLETEEEDLERLLNVNFKGILRTCQEAARSMIGTGTRGSIVTLSSGVVDSASPGLLCYGAAKAAVVQLTKILASETGPHGIRVNSVAPGWIRTPMTARFDSTQQRSVEEIMSRSSPLGRVGEAEEVAHTVLHLASDASAFTTGQILRPNGGVAMPW